MNFQFRFSHIWPWWDGNEDKDCFLVVQTGPWIQRTIAARIIDGKLGECTVSSSGQDAQPAVRSHQLASSWHLHLTAFSTWRKNLQTTSQASFFTVLVGLHSHLQHRQESFNFQNFLYDWSHILVGWLPSSVEAKIKIRYSFVFQPMRRKFDVARPRFA